MSRPMFDSEYLYGLHDPGGEQLMLDAGAPGWVVISEEIKADPNDRGGGNYTHLSGRGLGVIVRLNYGYYETSTLPHSARYEDFARRCANFVRSSAGCRIWIIGNETNMRDEQPKAPAEQITPGLYVRCYRLCRRAIKEVDPGAQVLVGAVAPWNAETGDWIKYFEEVLKLLSGECDGFTLHTYGRSSDPATITSAETMDPPYNRYSKQFATYKDFLRVVPRSMRSLPCYITETNYGTDFPKDSDRWEDRNTGWVRRAYEEINDWDQQPGNQVIRALVLYRWASHDRFAIERKTGPQEDFKQALKAGFKWPQRVVVDDPFAALRQRLADLEAQVAKLLADLQKALGAGVAGAGPLIARIADLDKRAGDVAAAAAEADALTRGVNSLEALLALPPGAVPQPDLQDLRGSLAQSAPYPTRSLDAIRRVIVHHTAIPDGNLSPQAIAQGQVKRQSRPGITYHFLINADGAIYWTQPLEAVVEQTLKAEVNADSVGVALGGSFMTATPTEAQLISAGHLVAWLLATCQLSPDAVAGRLEIEKVGSPGNQWNTGARYRERLLADVQTWLSKQPPQPDDAELAVLRQRVDELTAQVGQLQGIAGQLQQETQTLRAALVQKEQDMAGLGDALAQRETALADLRDAAARKDLQIAGLVEQVQRLQGGAPTPGVVKPEIRDPGPLKQHDSKRYATRPLSDIKRIIVHHTVTSGMVTPQRVAEAQVGQGRPGITYHFLLNSDGTIYATQPLEVLTQQTTQPAANAEGVAVALAGNFTTAAPPAEQLNAAARLIAWLLVTHNLGNEAVVGRSELEKVGSPGNQWLSGVAFKNTLLAAVAAERAKAPSDGGSGGNDALVAQLRDQISGLTQERDSLQRALAQAQAEVERLRSAGGQAADLQAQVQSLQQQIADREATMAQLRNSIAALQAEIDRLRANQPGVPQPLLVDMVGKLQTHPTLPPYTERTRPITLIAVHHTDTPTTHTVQDIAHYHVFGQRQRGDKILKEPWPGVAYHYIVAADGTIFHCQPDAIRSYQVGGEPNNYAVAVSLIGRFMRTDLKGVPHPPEKQEPTAAQIASASQLIAWLMQKYSVPLQPQFEDGIPATGVVGHRDIWDQTKKGTTECPGDQWKTGITWRDRLLAAVQGWLDGRPQSRAKPIKHYLLFWDHGADWAQADWRNAQDYIAAFRPTAGFSVTDAMQAEVVTIVGGDAGVTGADEARLAAAGCRVFRLAGVDEADTRARLTALITAGTPYPSARRATRGAATTDPWDHGPEVSPDLPWDAWTVPDDWPPAGFDPLAAEDALIDIPGVTRGVNIEVSPPASAPPPGEPLPADLAGLKQRAAALESQLASAAQQLAPLAQLATQKSLLDTAAGQANQVATLLATVTALQGRAQRVRAQLAQRNDATPALRQRVVDLQAKLTTLFGRVSATAGLGPAIDQAQKDLQMALAGLGNLTGLQQQTAGLLAAAKRLRADLDKSADSHEAIVLQNPAPGVRISQSFGQNAAVYKAFGFAGHEGIDYACAIGTPIKAAAGGVVFRSGATSGNHGPDKDQGPYGIRVIVEHTWGSQRGYTIYAHLSSVSVKDGDFVRTGDEVGKSGNTGNSSGAHLHFSLILANQRHEGYPSSLSTDAWYHDPAPFMPGRRSVAERSEEDTTDMHDEEIICRPPMWWEEI